MQLNRHRRSRGFTLAEVLVTSVLLLLISSTIFTVYRYQMFAFKAQEAQLDTQESARGLIDLMSREIRLAGYDPRCTKAFAGVVAASAQGLQIQFDGDEDGAIGAGENIVYAWDTSVGGLTRSAGGEPVLLVTGTSTALTFVYYDANGNLLVPAGTPPTLTAAQRTAVRRIKVVLHVEKPNPDPLTGSVLVSEVVSNVDLRNRFLNGGVACP